ncbi:class IIb bacteriocin, lactobin A/cerein 7B family [Caldicellulosiruptor naganoensis]|uniref:Class IIb bacteriocin, lactobin A/cerein 7B family n=1 Tax=Caldicellulosiruptor naganoensis TaxID=29324 RepID=A0ABY7BL11_9FIRM|nr:class IIb bacteriocin, lactobin A/cerein 7B family [Caldicellulosiruptor naganoensis]WAM31711.1 class IIb bacteriocin, lactobin A/cerein 7B family [Caldicellulosiruptor naganoensis]
MVNESIIKNGYFVELQNSEMEIVNGGWINTFINVAKWTFKVIEYLGIVDALREFGRGFIDGWNEATRR